MGGGSGGELDCTDSSSASLQSSGNIMSCTNSAFSTQVISQYKVREMEENAMKGLSLVDIRAVRYWNKTCRSKNVEKKKKKEE